MDFEGIIEEYNLGPPYKFKKHVIDDCYKKATSRCNLAVQLVRKCYFKAERATSNCTGDHQYKKKKLSPTRMQAVKSPTFSISPVRPGESKEEAWKLVKINASCRQIKSSKKDCSSSVTVVMILFIKLSYIGYIILYCITCSVYIILFIVWIYILQLTLNIHDVASQVIQSAILL